jgi:DNA-binding HxlR family transcriptional regulator
MQSLTEQDAERCSIARSLEIIGQKWSILILREAILRGRTRFADFREALGVAPDVLTDRLARLVDAGVLRRQPYQEEGERQRVEYVLTEAGEALKPVLAAISAWGDEYAPSGYGPAALYAKKGTGEPVRLAFLDGRGNELPAHEVVALPGPGSRTVATT